jgi:hypothetical protein
MTCGIYKLNFEGTAKVYIGQSKNIEYRYTQHLYKLNKQTASRKMQEAHTLYGEPALSILTECEERYLTEYEKETISIWDSVENGFNTYEETRGSAPMVRERGEESASAIYSNAQISRVLDYLVDQPNLTAKQVSEETGINVHTIRAISALNEHKWLKDKYPQKYSILENLKGLQAKSSKFSSKALGKTYPSIVSPEGVVYPSLENVKAFCREHELQDTNLHQVLKGTRKSHKGWRLS